MMFSNKKAKKTGQDPRRGPVVTVELNYTDGGPTSYSKKKNKSAVGTKIRLLKSKLRKGEEKVKVTENRQDNHTKHKVSFSPKVENIIQYEIDKRNILDTEFILDNQYEYREKVKYKINKLEEIKTDTASEIFLIDLEEGIGKDSLRTKKGIAKKKAKYNNASANNLGLNEENPRMLTRQVTSWKIARALNMRILANEKYALDKQGNIMAVSAFLPNTARSMKEEMDHHIQVVEQRGYNPFEKEDYLRDSVFTPMIQKQLSDLQILDALFGQTDRHHGNIFIDAQNDKIYGIDNDQAFGPSNGTLNELNAIASFRVHSRFENRPGAVEKGWREYDPDKGIEFIQKQVDAKTADQILSLKESDLRELLKDNVGTAYEEYLTDEEVEATVLRLHAIQKHIDQLKKDGKLITKWGKETYNEAITTYGNVIETMDDEEILENTSLQYRHSKYQSYLARQVYMSMHGSSQTGYTKNNKLFNRNKLLYV